MLEEGCITILNRETWAPVGTVYGRLDDDLLAFLQGISLFHMKENQAEHAGIVACRDPCHPKDHVYYEGCFHSMPNTDPLPKLHPRWTCMAPIPPAPIELRAFCQALRDNMKSWLRHHVLPQLRRHRTVPGVSSLQDVLERGVAFGSVAVQFHAGRPVQGSSMNWHHDNANSLLHLAVGIRGTRLLHSLRRPLGQTNKVDVIPERVDTLKPGDVYVSSPTLFDHAVEYPHAASWKDGVIAIQCRFLLTEEENEYLLQLVRKSQQNAHASPSFWRVWAEAIHGLANHRLLPSLAQVQAIVRDWNRSNPHA